MSRQRIYLTLALMFLSISSVQAANIRIVVGGLGDTPGKVVDLDDSDGQFSTNPDGTQRWSGTWEDDTASVDWNFFLDPDPGVSGSLAMTNNSSSPQFFSASVGLPVTAAFSAGSSMVGSSSISIVDANFDKSASISAPVNSSIYQGKIQNVTQRSLFSDPFALSVASTAGSTSQSASFSGETTSTNLPIGGTISVTHAFTLSAGDSATTNSAFFVVPEPTCGVAMISSAVCLLWLGRRSRR